MPAPVVFSAVPTAFAVDGSLDLAATARIYEHAVEGGVDSLFVNGTTGEFTALDRDERQRLLALAVEVAGAERVIAHVGAATPFQVAGLTADAAELGIERMSVLTPFYMPASGVGVRSQVASAASAAPEASLFLYLFPDRTGVRLAPSEAAAILDDLDIAGAKLSIAGVDYLADLVAALREPRIVLSGNDGLLPEVVAAGGAGVVSGVSSAAPEPFVALAAAVGAGDEGVAASWRAVVDTLVPVLGPSIRALKASLVAQGVIDDATCRIAVDPLTPEVLAAAQSVVADADTSTLAVD